MIALCIQKGNYVQIFDEKNRMITQRFGELHGYTGSAYSVKKGNYVYTFDEKGHQLSVKFVG